MSAQGKPGYFVDAKTGMPPDHIAGVIGCVCPACLPVSDADRAAMVNDLVEAFDISPGEAATHVAMVEMEANARANGTASLSFVEHEVDGTYCTADDDVLRVEPTLEDVAAAVADVRAIRDVFEVTRAQLVAAHGHIPVALAEAKASSLTPEQRERLTTIIGMDPPRIILSPEEQERIRDSIVVERTEGGGLQSMVSTALVSMSLVDIEERFGKGSELAIFTRGLTRPHVPRPPPPVRYPDPPVAWESERHKRLAQELAWAASGSSGDDCVEDEDYHRQAAELLAELDALVEPKRKLHIGATGGDLIGLVAPCEPCTCGAGAFDQPATAALYVADHKASLQCNACGSWRVL